MLPPLGVYFTALLMRLVHTWESSSSLPQTSTGSNCAVSVCPFSRALPSSRVRLWLICSSSQKFFRTR